MESIVNLSINGTYFLLLVFGLFMLAATYLFARWHKFSSVEGFLVGRRQVNWLLGGSSIAASWIWAPALFVSTLFAYQNGLVGLFWFVVPNILALAVFAILAPTIRKKMPYGYTLPQWVRHKLKDEKVHKIYLFPFFFYQLMAVTVQLYAGGNLLALMLGIPVYQAVAVLAIAACVVVPTVLSLYWDKLNPKGVFWGVLIAFFVGLPIFIYSNLIENNIMTVLSSLGIIAITTIFCLAIPRKTAWKAQDLQ